MERHIGTCVLVPVAWETMRASGPGGQHVNRTESAVRVTHLPTGVQASASEERSQHRNRKLALARLAAKLEEQTERSHGELRQQRWRAHQDLERGNAVRVLRGTAPR
jgi:peptide chain release factor